MRCAGVTALLTTNRQPLYQCRVTRSHTESASVEREYQHCYQQQHRVSQCDETHRWIQFHSDRPVSTHWCGSEEPVLNHNTRHDHTNFRPREHRSNLMFSRFSFSSIKIKKFDKKHLPYQEIINLLLLWNKNFFSSLETYTINNKYYLIFSCWTVNNVLCSIIFICIC